MSDYMMIILESFYFLPSCTIRTEIFFLIKEYIAFYFKISETKHTQFNYLWSSN